MNWDKDALVELERVPEFVRNMAKSAVEKRAKEKGLDSVTAQTMSEVKEKYFSTVGQKKGEKELNIAIVRCDIVSEACPGVGCMKAFNNRKVHFEQYGEEVNLISVFTCGGCSGRRVQRLVDKLKSNHDLDIVHLASCMLFEGNYPKCPFKNAIKDSIETKGIKVVEGTHH